MGIPDPARERALRTPRRDHLSTEVVLDDLVIVAADGREIPIRSDHDMLRLAETSELLEILAVLIENLNAVIVSIVDEDVTRRWIHRNAVNVAEIPWASVHRTSWRPT